MLVFFTATLPHFWVILSISSLPFPIENGLSFQPLTLYTRIPPNTIFPRIQVDGGTKEENLTLTFSPAVFFSLWVSLRFLCTKWQFWLGNFPIYYDCALFRPIERIFKNDVWPLVICINLFMVILNERDACPLDISHKVMQPSTRSPEHSNQYLPC